MRYLIAHIIEHEAKAYHLALAQALATRHRLTPPAARIDPHLTVKAPFALPEGREGEIDRITEMLHAFTEKESPEPYTLSGFDAFTDKVVFLSVEAPKQTHMLLRRLQDRLRTVSWMQFRRYEFPLTLHATLAYPKSREQSREILAGLKHERALFPHSLDTLTLLKEVGERWEPVHTFPIGLQNH